MQDSIGLAFSFDLGQASEETFSCGYSANQFNSNGWKNGSTYAHLYCSILSELKLASLVC